MAIKLEDEDQKPEDQKNRCTKIPRTIKPEDQHKTETKQQKIRILKIRRKKQIIKPEYNRSRKPECQKIRRSKYKMSRRPE